MKLARVNQAEGLFAAVREEDTVADDLAVKVDVRLGDGRYPTELGRNR